MPDVFAVQLRVCSSCGEPYTVARYARGFCSIRCQRRAEWTDPPTLAAWLDSLTAEFVAAVRIDSGYLENMASEGAKVLASRGTLPGATASS